MNQKRKKKQQTALFLVIVGKHSVATSGHMRVMIFAIYFALIHDIRSHAIETNPPPQKKEKSIVSCINNKARFLSF